MAFTTSERVRQNSITGRTRDREMADQGEVKEEAANEIQRWAMQRLFHKKRLRVKNKKERLLREWAAIKIQTAWKQKAARDKVNTIKKRREVISSEMAAIKVEVRVCRGK